MSHQENEKIVRLNCYQSFFAVAMFSMCLSASSLTLGPSRGAAVFNRPLDITVQLRLDEAIADTTSCISAETYQGDVQFDSARLRIDVKPTTNPLDVLVRIRSASAITEPWAKLVLHVSCGSKMSKTYDFLTDFSANDESEINAIRLPENGSTRTVIADTQAIKNSLAPLYTSGVQSRKVTKNSRQTKSTRAVQVKGGESLSSTTILPNAPSFKASENLKVSRELSPKAQQNNDVASRLKIENIDLQNEHQVMLKLSSALLTPTASAKTLDPQALAQARAVWHALNAKPEDLAADALKLQAASAELRQLTKTSADLQLRLNAAEQNGFSNWIVYGLSALLALALAGIALAWLRLRQNAQSAYTWLSKTSGTDFTHAAAEAIDERDATEENIFVETRHVQLKPKQLPNKEVDAIFAKTRYVQVDAFNSAKASGNDNSPSTEASAGGQSVEEASDTKANVVSSSDFKSKRKADIDISSDIEQANPPEDFDINFNKIGVDAVAKADSTSSTASDSASATPSSPSKTNLIDFDSFQLPSSRKKT